jgi:hypothetical protein
MIARTGILAGRGSSSTPLLLDTYSGAAAAYSLRKLNSSYSGSAIRVRRSSDNTESDIGFTSSGDLDESALLSFVGSGSGFVHTWYDQSGNARNAVQATTANQPRIVNAGVVEKQGTRASVFMDGTNDFLSNTTITNTTNTLSGFFVQNKIAAGSSTTNNNSRIFSANGITGFDYDSNNGIALAYGRTASNIYTYRNNADLSSINVVFNTYNLISLIHNGSVSKLKYNNTEATSVASTANFNYTKIAIGSYLEGSVGRDFLNGYYSEFILFHFDQSTNRTAIEQNINNYYNIY